MDENSQMPFFDLSGTDLNFLLRDDFDELPSVSQLLNTQQLKEIDQIPEGELLFFKKFRLKKWLFYFFSGGVGGNF